MSTAFSRCLAISDIFHQIVIEVQYTFDGHRSLAALAATSRTFHEHVLPVLWQNLRSLVPLLKLLPAHTWTETLDSADQMVFTLTTSEDIDWSRFKKYVRHVRSFTWLACENVSTSTLAKLPFVKPPNEPFFPHLRSLFVTDYREEYTSKLSFLFSPTLINLYIAWPPEYCPDTLLEDIRGTCGPQLEELHLCLNVTGSFTYDLMNLHDTTQAVLTRCIAAFPGLRRLSCLIPPSPAAFEAFAALPRLRKLAVRLPRNALDEIVRELCTGTRTGSWFPALTDLDFAADQLNDDVCALLASFSSTLKGVSAQAIAYPSTHDVRQFTETLARSAYAETLTDLTILFAKYGRHPYPEHAPPTVTVDVGQALEPVLQRPPRQLAVLHVEGDSVAMSDGDLLRIAESYPSLRSLVIRSTDGSPGDEYPSARSLLMIAQKCPRLVELVLHFDGAESNIPSQAEVDDLIPSPSTHPLENFFANESLLTNTVDGVRSLARFITRVYPSARFRCAHYRVPLFRGEDLYHAWDQVGRIINRPGECQYYDDFCKARMACMDEPQEST